VLTNQPSVSCDVLASWFEGRVQPGAVWIEAWLTAKLLTPSMTVDPDQGRNGVWLDVARWAKGWVYALSISPPAGYRG
jgi:hypothetical protein